VLLLYILHSCDFRNHEIYIWNKCHYTKFECPFLVGVIYDSKEINVVLGPKVTRCWGECRGTHRHGDENTCTIFFPSFIVLANEANNRISISEYDINYIPDFRRVRKAAVKGGYSLRHIRPSAHPPVFSAVCPFRTTRIRLEDFSQN